MALVNTLPRCEPERLIDVISLIMKADDNRAFWLGPDWQGRDLMTEASAVVTRFLFATSSRLFSRVPKAVQNEASRKLSQREGMRVVLAGQRDLCL